MLSTICKKVLLGSSCLLAGLSAWGQQHKVNPEPLSTDVGVTLAFERAYIAPGSCNCFWFKGGGADATVTLWKGLGIAAALTGDHSSNVATGIDANKITYLFGPRYTVVPSALNPRFQSLRSLEVFGEGLFGGAHAFNSSFPSAAGIKASADSYAMQIGGGIQIPLAKGLSVRALEADYVRTALPNNYSDVQNDLRLGFGVSYHVGSLPLPRRH